MELVENDNRKLGIFYGFACMFFRVLMRKLKTLIDISSHSVTIKSQYTLHN